MLCRSTSSAPWPTTRSCWTASPALGGVSAVPGLAARPNASWSSCRRGFPLRLGLRVRPAHPHRHRVRPHPRRDRASSPSEGTEGWDEADHDLVTFADELCATNAHDRCRPGHAWPPAGPRQSCSSCSRWPASIVWCPDCLNSVGVQREPGTPGWPGEPPKGVVARPAGLVGWPARPGRWAGRVARLARPLGWSGRPARPARWAGRGPSPG